MKLNIYDNSVIMNYSFIYKIIHHSNMNQHILINFNEQGEYVNFDLHDYSISDYNMDTLYNIQYNIPNYVGGRIIGIIYK